MPSSPVDQLARSLDATGRLVEGVRDDQWDLSTPCAQWSVRDLVQHLVIGNRLFAEALLDGSPPVDPADSEPPAAAYRHSANALIAAFESPGALERLVTIPLGTVPGLVALNLRLVEALVHGWDLATATGQSPGHDESLAEQALEFTRPQLDRIPADRTPFAPPQPIADDAPALDRLAACLGRPVDAPR